MANEQFINWLRSVGRKTLDLALPPLCLRCDAAVTEPGSFCAACWRQLRFISAPHCPRCGLPYELGRGDLPCPSCLSDAPPYEMARAAVVYDEASRPLVLRFKHADQTHLAGALARMMAQGGAALLPGCDLLAPVPLHRARIFQRCYNQSALLTRLLARQHAIAAIPGLLTRQRATKPQASLNAKERARNVRHAFCVTPRHRKRVIGKTIGLIDDVLTTGATVHDCIRALTAAGAAQVRVLTFARTL